LNISEYDFLTWHQISPPQLLFQASIKEKETKKTLSYIGLHRLKNARHGFILP